MAEFERESHGRLGRHSVPESDALSGVDSMLLAAELARRDLTLSDTATYRENQRIIAAFRAAQLQLASAIDVTANRFSVKGAAVRTHFTRQCVKEFGVPVKGATHVDMGCGAINPFGRMFVHCLAGVGKAYCIDLDTTADEAAAMRHLADLAGAALVNPQRVLPGADIPRELILENLRDFDLAALSKGDVRGMSSRIEFRQCSVSETGLEDESADVTFSNSLLEHVPDVDEVFAEWRRITKPGGFGIHGIDTVDHRSYGDASIHPLEFLTEETSSCIVHGSNRLRMTEFGELFMRNGFEVLKVHGNRSVPIDATFRERCAPQWRDSTDEELGTTWSVFLVQRI